MFRRRVQAIQISVVTREKDAIFPGDRRHSDRSGSEIRPQFRTRFNIVRRQLVAIVEAEKQSTAQHDRLQNTIVGHQIEIQSVIPSLLPRRELTRPLQRQFSRQLLGRRSTT